MPCLGYWPLPWCEGKETGLQEQGFMHLFVTLLFLCTYEQAA